MGRCRGAQSARRRATWPARRTCHAAPWRFICGGADGAPRGLRSKASAFQLLLLGHADGAGLMYGAEIPLGVAVVSVKARAGRLPTPTAAAGVSAGVHITVVSQFCRVKSKHLSSQWEIETLPSSTKPSASLMLCFAAAGRGGGGGTRKRHTMPHPAQPQHTNYWAPRTRKRHQQEHRPQRPTESSDPTQQWTARTARGGTGHLGLTETQRGRLWTACGQRCVDSKNSQTTPATTSTTPNTPTTGRR